MITENDLLVMSKVPEIRRALAKPVNAVIEMRKELAVNQSGLWAAARLKKKEYTAVYQVLDFAKGVVFNGMPLSDEEQTLVRRWVAEVATFRTLPKEEQDKVRMHNPAQADLLDIEVAQ
jgi:hypothetical protein